MSMTTISHRDLSMTTKSTHNNISMTVLNCQFVTDHLDPWQNSLVVKFQMQLKYMFSSFSEEKTLKDDEILQNLPVGTSATMYFRDLGPQLGWTMVKRTHSKIMY